MSRFFIIQWLLFVFAGETIAQSNYSTIHFIAKTNSKMFEKTTVPLIFNNQLAATVRYSEAVNYKIYSEGRFSVNMTVILNVKHGGNYYLLIDGKGVHGVRQELLEVDSVKWYTEKATCTYDSNMEEDIRNPFGTIDYSKHSSGPAQGTCFLISPAGYLITNYHVIENAKEITVKGIDGDYSTKYNATVVGSDKTNDLALLKISNSNVQFGSLPFALRGSGVQQGERVYALGFPNVEAMGKEVKLTEGIISAKSGAEGDMSKFQISAAVNPGNSGGPLIDEQGNIIGVVYAKSTVADAAGYAVKTSYLQAFLDNIEGFQLPALNSTLKDRPITAIVAELGKYIFIVEAK